MKVDFKLLKYVPVNHKHEDPVRYPNVVNGYEMEFKKAYTSSLNNMMNQMLKDIVTATNNNKS
jgi:hypothetical protein